MNCKCSEVGATLIMAAIGIRYVCPSCHEETTASIDSYEVEELFDGMLDVDCQSCGTSFHLFYEDEIS